MTVHFLICIQENILNLPWYLEYFPKKNVTALHSGKIGGIIPKKNVIGFFSLKKCREHFVPTDSFVGLLQALPDSQEQIEALII